MPQSRIIRVPGTAVFMTGNLDFVPNALLHNLKHNKVLHEQVFFVNVRTLDVPQASPTERATANEVAPGIFKSRCVTASWKARTCRAPWKA